MAGLALQSAKKHGFAHVCRYKYFCVGSLATPSPPPYKLCPWIPRFQIYWRHNIKMWFYDWYNRSIIK